MDSIYPPFLLNIIINTLEFILASLLSPIFMWQWLSKRNYLLKFLEIIFEVAAELLILIVFAGVSIVTAAVLTYEEAYNDAQSTKMILKFCITDENLENPGPKKSTLKAI